jgi:hypothetical protein
MAQFCMIGTRMPPGGTMPGGIMPGSMPSIMPGNGGCGCAENGGCAMNGGGPPSSVGSAWMKRHRLPYGQCPPVATNFWQSSVL